MCKSANEKAAVIKIEETLHEADYMASIDLDGETFGIIANSKNEDAVVFEVGDSNTVVEDKKDDKKESL